MTGKKALQQGARRNCRYWLHMPDDNVAAALRFIGDYKRFFACREPDK